MDERPLAVSPILGALSALILHWEQGVPLVWAIVIAIPITIVLESIKQGRQYWSRQITGFKRHGFSWKKVLLVGILFNNFRPVVGMILWTLMAWFFLGQAFS